MMQATLKLDDIYTALQEITPVMVVGIDLKSGKLNYHNARFIENLVANPDMLEDSTIYDFVDDESYIPLAQLLSATQHTPTQEAQIGFIDKHQHTFQTQLYSYINPDNAQQLLLFLEDTREQHVRDNNLEVFQKIFASTNEWIALLDRDLKYRMINRAFLQGLRIHESEILNRPAQEIHTEHVETMLPLVQQVLNEGKVTHQKLLCNRKAGYSMFLECTYSPYYDENGEIDGVIIGARNITDQVTAEQKMASSHNHYKMLFQYSPDMLASVNLDSGDIIESNAMFARVLGYRADEVCGSSIFRYHAGPCKETLAEAIALLSEQDSISDLELCLCHKNGALISSSLRTTPMVDLKRNIAIFVWRDTRKQKQLAHDASHDQLTKLLNRAGFMEQYEKGFRQADTRILCYFDVDNFKTLNDTYGHLLGDNFLIELAALMSQHLSAYVVGRIGGDEFVAMLHQSTIEESYEMMQALSDAIQECVNANQQYSDSGLGVSIGITPYWQNESRRVVLQRADNACYESKRHGKHQITIYEVQGPA